MMRLIHAEWLKLRSTRSGWLIGGITVVVSVLVASLQLGLDTHAESGTLQWGRTAERFADPDAIADLVAVAPVIAMVVAIVGSIALPTEVRYRTITSTYLAVPSRPRIVAAKAITVAVAGAALAMLVQGAVLGISFVWLEAVGADFAITSDTARILVLTPAATALTGVLGVGVGAILHQQVAAVLAVTGWIIVVEQLIAGLAPSLRPGLPFTGAITVLGSGGDDTISAGRAAITLAAYTTVAIVTGTQVFRRRDLT